MSLALIERALIRAVLLRPNAIKQNLTRIRAVGMVERVPNLWQLTQGVLRMWGRLAFRSETVGTCQQFSPRSNWRARLLELRAIRLPFLLAERAVTPWDLSGLMSSPEQVIRHVITAHHDGRQFAYDLQILACYGDELRELRREVDGIVRHDTSRSRWLRDLAVYERYHENLLEAVDRALEGDYELGDGEAGDPDIAFTAYLEWCAQQPATLGEALRLGRATTAEVPA